MAALGHRADDIGRFRTLSDAELRKAFWAKVDKSGECWLWQGGVDAEGHGRIGLFRGTASPRRYAWEITNGALPSSKQVRTTCGNRLCVRPDHLRLGKGRR